MKNIISSGLLLVISTSALALSNPFPAYPNGRVFSTYEVRNFSLEAPLTELFNSRTGNSFTSKKYTVSGSISYLDDHNQKITISAKIRLKGHITLVNCPFPKMELELSQKQTSNTIFEGTKQIDLNTHCAEPTDSKVDQRLRYSFENHREALIYRIMEILEMPTLKARSVMMQYFDSTPNNSPIVESSKLYQAFFLEDMSDFRRRLDAKEIKGARSEQKSYVDPSDQEKLSQYSFTLAEETPNIDYSDIARITLFQYVVGNTDWNLRTFSSNWARGKGDFREDLYNIKLIELPDQTRVFFPADFGLALMVTNDLATTDDYFKFIPDRFEVAKASERIQILKNFIDKKDVILDLFKESTDSESLKIRAHLAEIFQNMEAFLSFLEKNTPLPPQLKFFLKAGS